MRRDRLLLRVGYIVSAIAGAEIFVKLGTQYAVAVFATGLVMTRILIYVYFERLLAYKSFDDFTSGKIKHECIACGASCHLKVNLAKDDVERILGYANEKGLQEIIIEKRGKNYWLKRRKGACVFLKYEGSKPRCSIYTIRPTACRLYPLIPSGRALKLDPLCPGLSKTRGHTFKEHLVTQEVGPYVRKVLGKI